MFCVEQRKDDWFGHIGCRPVWAIVATVQFEQQGWDLVNELLAVDFDGVYRVLPVDKPIRCRKCEIQQGLKACYCDIAAND